MLSVFRKTKNLIYQLICSCKCFIVRLYRFYCMVQKFMVMINLTLLSLYFLQFYKIIMSFKKSTPYVILCRKLGRYPADILIKSRMIGFWKRLVCGKRDKISCTMYNLMYKIYTRNLYFSKWLDCVQNTFK